MINIAYGSKMVPVSEWLTVISNSELLSVSINICIYGLLVQHLVQRQAYSSMHYCIWLLNSVEMNNVTQILIQFSNDSHEPQGLDIIFVLLNIHLLASILTTMNMILT